MTPIVDSKTIEKIVLEHLLKVRQLEEDTCHVLKDRIDHLITRLLLRINQNLKNIDCIKCYDGLYYCVEDQKSEYEAFLLDLDAHIEEVSDGTVRDIFTGIREMAVDFQATLPMKGDNPITYERMVLISACILRIKQYWHSLLEEESIDCRLTNNVTKDGLLSLMNRQVRDFFFNGMYTTNQMIDESLIQLSVFEEGKKYEAFARTQIKDLSSLVMMQRDVVRAQLKTEEETLVVNRLMDRLAHIYKMSVKAVGEMEEASTETISAVDVINMEQVEGILEAHIYRDADNVESLLKRTSQIREESISELREIIDNEVNCISTEISQKANRKASGYQLLSGQLVGLFNETVDKLTKLNRSYVSEGGSTIAEGIITTMSLKLERLREKDTNYQIGKKNLAIELEQLLMEQKHCFIEQVDCILEDIIENSEQVLIRTQKQFFDSVDVISLKHFKYDMTYMKNDLLFELRTFEELIEHSLKKLIELELDNAKDLTGVMLGSMEKSRDILAAHGIDFIHPKPHDRVERKLHEVMLAETSLDFPKDEIIRTVNVGYQLKDYVIIRASVMAAK